MKVPVNPQTRLPQGQLGYGQNHDVSSGVKALGQVVEEHGKYLLQEDKKRELFDVQRMIVDETNALQVDFEKKSSIEVLGAPAFTQRVNSEYNTRHQQLVEDARKRGYSEEALQEFGTRLGTIRSQYVARAIDFQDKSRFAKVVGDTEQMAIGLSQYADKNPNAVSSTLDELRVALTHTDLDAIEQQQIYDKESQGIKLAARQGFARDNPDVVIGLFDPEDPAAPVGASTTEIVGVNGPQKEIAGEFQTAGFRPAVIAGFLGNFDVEGGYKGALGDNGTASGAAQWRGERRANFVKMFGKDPHKATMAENAKFVIWEMQNPDEAGMTVAQRDAILNAKTPEEAATLVDKYYERSSGEHRDRRIAAAKLYTKTMEKADSTVAALEGPTIRADLVDAKGKTGIAIVDLSTGPERMQMLAWAKQNSNENSAVQRAGLEVDHQNAVTAYLTTGAYAGGERSAEDYTRVYGPVVGPQKFAEMQNAKEVGADIQQFKTQSAEQISMAVEALRPKDTASPTYTTELQAYERAQNAAAATLKARNDDPAGYLFATFPKVTKQLQDANDPNTRRAAYLAVNETYNKLGIAPDRRVMMNAQQARALQEKYAAIPHAQKIRQLDQWNKELGPLYQPFMRQLTNDGYDAGEDSVMWSMLSKHPNGFSTMSQVLQGQNILKEDPARRPGKDVINTNFKTTLGSAIGMLNPAASKIYNDAAAAIYVANGGQTEGGQLTDPDAYQEALRLAVGGLPKNKDSGIVDMTQGAVKEWTILPQRTTRREFTNWVERLTPGVLTRMSVERSEPLYRTGNQVDLNDIIDEGVFVAVAPGAYIIKMSSDGMPLKTKSGNNFIVRINPGNPKPTGPLPSFRNPGRAPRSNREPIYGNKI